MKPKKIAIIVRRMNVRGGIQRHVLELARILLAHGHQVTLYTFLSDRTRCYPDLLPNVRIVSLGSIPAYRNALQGLWSEWRATRALSALIAPETEILNPHDDVSYKVAYHFKKMHPQIPSVWTVHDMPTKFFSAHRRGEVDAQFHPSMGRRFLYRVLDAWNKPAVAAQDAIAVLDERDRREAKRAFARDAVIVRNGVDISALPFEKRTHAVRDAKCALLMCGIFAPHRRFEDGIEALGQLRESGVDASLTILGNSSADAIYHQTVVDFIRARNLTEHVRLAGILPDDEFLQQFYTHDVFLFPNVVQSWGLVVFEAMATGLPTVVSRGAGASEVITDGVDGLLVPERAPQAIVDAVQKIITDDSLRAFLSERGRALVEETLSWEQLATAMEKLFGSAFSQ
jgi:glycosyltransferase involved in cell wall biosynthesis